MCCEGVVKFFCFFIAIAVFIACKGEEPVAQVLNSNADKPEVVQFNGLFFKLIGREVGRKDRGDIGGFTKADLHTKSYAEQVDAILQSKQFYAEGFWHFHEDRLLLAKETRMIAETIDRAALRMEMADVARADNYWDILTYRDRWLSIEGLKLRECNSYLNSRQYEKTQNKYEDKDKYEENQDEYRKAHDEYAARQASNRQSCAHFLQAVMHPEVEHYDICVGYEGEKDARKARKFTASFSPRCCAEDVQDTEMCNKINAGYVSLFNEDFCAVAAKPVIDSHCNAPPPEPGNPSSSSPPRQQASLPFTWNDTKLYQALSLYISLHLSEEADVFIEASVLPNGNDIYRQDKKTYENFIKATLPENLQGIHASPYWLSTHYTSDDNQHLHRARIIYHSWFCEGISPNQAKQEGGQPSEEEKAAFASYFPKDDKHKDSSRNCFDCHKIIQPLANYFGRLSVGIKYAQDERLGLHAARFLQKESAASKLPLRKNIGTGYYDMQKDKFYQWGHNKSGMAGLATLLHNLPKAKRCIVKYTWNKIFGCENELSEKEISDSVTHLTSYRALLKHFMMTDKARAYFIPEIPDPDDPDPDKEPWNGQDKLEEMVARERAAQSLSCTEAEAEAEDISGESIAANTCALCHQFLESNRALDNKLVVKNDSGVWEFNNDIGNDYLKTVYQRSNSTEFGLLMPIGGYQDVKELDNAKAIQRKVFKCFIEQKAKDKDVALPAIKDTRCATIDHKTMHRIEP